MLTVKTPEEVLEIISTTFLPLEKNETVSIYDAIGRILAEDIVAEEYVPDFNRSTVDGYAVRAKDTFGCSDAIPAILQKKYEVLMGESAEFTLKPDSCCTIPTGGAVPEGADSIVMIEYTEDYQDGTVGIQKPTAPGMNMIFRGDDVFPGKKVLSKGTVLHAQDIGALAAIGRMNVPVISPVVVGILSTGDELIPPEEHPAGGQIRDVNGPMLSALLQNHGAKVVSYGICKDDKDLLRTTVEEALSTCDVVILSGGSSVGVKDAACQIIESLGTVLFHGISMKPGKPTILGQVNNKPIFGLPGHPVAAFFTSKLFVLPTLDRLQGRINNQYTVAAILTESISANHGRSQYVNVFFEKKDGITYAHPIRGKSGLITTLAGCDGFFCIEGNCEGLSQGTQVQVYVDMEG